MKKYVNLVAAAGAALSLSLAAAVPSAEAGPRHHFNGHGGYYGHSGYRRHGRGYWRGGRWIALGIGAAALAGAAGAYERDCYWRHGYRVCD